MSSFPETRWTLIITAGHEGGKAAEQALAELCQSYWYPVYAFIRRSGALPEHAEDLTQGFFSNFLERRSFALADPARGRFRSFLLGSVKNFLRDQSDRKTARKRGGASVVTMNLDDAETKYARAFADQVTPEQLFEREWAATLITRVNDELRLAFTREGRGTQFEHLRRFLPGCDVEGSYAEAANQLGTSEGSLKVTVHRLRRRYREIFRAEIARLVSDPGLIDDELRRLLEVLRT